MPSGRVLIVDDEPLLLDLISQYLSRLGYIVETYSRPEQALEVFVAAPQAYSLVIADLSLPGIPGTALAGRMLELNSGLQVLICSGYPTSVADFPPALQSRVTYLQKPFLPRALASAIQRVLPGAQAPTRP